MKTVRSNETSDSDISTDALTNELKTLEISSSRCDDEAFLSPTSGGLVSSTSDEGIATKPATSEPRKRLNKYLIFKESHQLLSPGWNGIRPLTVPSYDTPNDQ